LTESKIAQNQPNNQLPHKHYLLHRR